MNIEVNQIQNFQRTLTVPGDKSLSHRALLFSALARGASAITGLSTGEDVQSTRRCLEDLGIPISGDEPILVQGKPFTPPTQPLDCGNSGTTLRLLMGVLSSFPHPVCLQGDSSLSNRPMNRIAVPLRQMGSEISLRESNFAPVQIQGKVPLQPIDYTLPVASAQLKSALLLAALSAEGTTHLRGRIDSRDHTEQMLRYHGVDLSTSSEVISVSGPQSLKAANIHVPGDPSSAAFWIAAACLIPQAQVTVENLLLNPTRMGLFTALRKMGASVSWEIQGRDPEPFGSLQASQSPLCATQIGKEDVPSLVDEIPLLAVVASQAEGTTKITGAEELRIKETDRIEAVAVNLRKMGVEVETLPDGLTLTGPQKLRGATVDSFGDHRIAMAFAIAGLIATGTTTILHADSVQISYPEFFSILKGTK